MFIFVLVNSGSRKFIWVGFFFHLLLLAMEGKRAFTQKRFEGEAFNLIHVKYSEALLMEASLIHLLLSIDIWGIIYASR